MGFWTVVASLLRRRSVAIPVVLAASAVAVLGFALNPVRYSSSTTMVLTTPAYGDTVSQDPNRPNGLTNPLLNFDTGLKTTSAILIQAMNTPEALGQLGADGGGTKIVVDDGSSNPALLDANGPFIYIRVDSATAAKAQAEVTQAQKLIRQQLVDRQVALNAPRQTFIAITDVVSPTTPEIVRTTQMKVTGVGFVGTFVVGMSLAYYLHRRKHAPVAYDRSQVQVVKPMDHAAGSTSPRTVRRLNGSRRATMFANGSLVASTEGGHRQLGQWPHVSGDAEAQPPVDTGETSQS